MLSLVRKNINASLLVQLRRFWKKFKLPSRIFTRR